MFLEFVAHIALGQSATIVLRCHNLAVGSCRSDGQQVATLSLVQVYLFGKHIGALADRTNYIVGLTWLVAAYVLYLVVSLIECGTNQVGKSSIYDSEFLYGTFLYL